MATLSFRLPAIRMETRPARRSLSHGSGSVCAMNAEEAARIALRRMNDQAFDVATGSLHVEVAAGEAVSSGWFDSTWELSKGLDISEGMPADLPLDGWLQLYLAA